MAAHRKSYYDEALKLYNAGMSIGDLAAFYQVTRQAMWEGLNRRGCVFRDQLRFGEDNHFHRGTKADALAHDLTESAIRKGVLVRPEICDECKKPSTFKNGRSGIEAHHADYNKPLEINWLCQKCHFAWHKKHKAIPFHNGN